MAGPTPTGFDETAFRDAVLFAMGMGMAKDPAEQLVWKWDRVRTFNPQDSAENPYSWTQTPVTDVAGNTSVTNDELIVSYALEFDAGTSVETPIGQFDRAKAVVTLLDSDYEQVKDADYVQIGTSKYDIDYVAPQMALFDVGVVQVYLVARDEA